VAASREPENDAISITVTDGLMATDKVSTAIRQGIRTGRFVPGQHLVEADLTRRLGISRGSLREALKRLAADGIVTLNHYRGAYISVLDRKSVDDLLDVLEQLNRLAAANAARNCVTNADRERIENAVAAVKRHRDGADPGQYLTLRQSFYDALFEVGGNRELARVTPLSRADLFRAQVRPFQSLQQQRRHVDGYAAIAAAVLSGDPARAERAVKRHFAATRRSVASLPPEAFDTPA
jgi:DNA-binding GntR family transcriptional regulator